MKFVNLLIIYLSQLPLYLTYAPMQLWKWQLYLSQNMRNQLLGSWQDEPSEDDQDTLKVRIYFLNTHKFFLLKRYFYFNYF